MFRRGFKSLRGFGDLHEFLEELYYVQEIRVLIYVTNVNIFLRDKGAQRIIMSVVITCFCFIKATVLRL